jgi:hypothetical protein
MNSLSSEYTRDWSQGGREEFSKVMNLVSGVNSTMFGG